MSSEALKSAATLASYNIILQLTFRVLTFVLNAFVLRFITKDLLGVVNVRLTLLYSTVLFISREAFRRALLSKETEDRSWPQVVNLVWCALPIGAVCGCLLGYVWASLLEQPSPELVPHYGVGVVCYALAAVIELTAEPLYVIGQILLHVRLRVIVEGVAIALRCLTTVAMVLLIPQHGVVGFCIAQLAYSAITVCCYYVYFGKQILTQNVDTDFPFTSLRQVLPSRQKPIFSAGLTTLTWTFFKQGFLKQLLTEGERYVMTIFGVLSFADQGIYDVVNNLGSLVARFVFLPLEDSAYLFFTQTLRRGRPAAEQQNDSLELSSGVLGALLKVVSLVGWTIVAFGYAYSHLFLDIYGGTLLSSGTGPTLLKSFCVYILLLAVNGITECFTNATMSKAQLDSYNHKMLLFSIIFFASSLVFTHYLGSVGFILANCVNMLARITHNTYHISHYYAKTRHRPLLDLAPSFWVTLILISSFILTSTSEILFCCGRGVFYHILHLALGLFCGLTLILTVYFTERKLIKFIIDKFKRPDASNINKDK